MIEEKEQVAILETMSKLIDARLKKLRKKLNEELLDSANAGGDDRTPLYIGTDNVGNMAVSYSHPTIEIKPECVHEAMAYLNEVGMTERVLKKDWKKQFKELNDGTFVDVMTGEQVGFLYMTPKVPSSVKVTIDNPMKAIKSTPSRLPNGIIGLLEV